LAKAPTKAVLSSDSDSIAVLVCDCRAGSSSRASSSQFTAIVGSTATSAASLVPFVIAIAYLSLSCSLSLALTIVNHSTSRLNRFKPLSVEIRSSLFAYTLTHLWVFSVHSSRSPPEISFFHFLNLTESRFTLTSTSENEHHFGHCWSAALQRLHSTPIGTALDAWVDRFTICGQQAVLSSCSTGLCVLRISGLRTAPASTAAPPAPTGNRTPTERS
jgi:uncharacterized membrane protein YbhN (UPF0104 family)